MAQTGEYGEVLSVEGPLVKVKMKQHVSCASCAQHRICFPTGRYRVLIAQAGKGINEGDTVFVLFRSGPAIISSLLIFVGSVVVPLTAWLAADLADAPKWVAFTAAGAALIVYWAFLYLLNRRLKRSGWFLPCAVKGTEPVEEKEKEK
ncbi:SoxR reducing system RseC family protein [candidate division WOR-3 bacterium]|nr:SoxR reducing system RseC family protein [candidate division WOR-3 bacterium]